MPRTPTARLTTGAESTALAAQYPVSPSGQPSCGRKFTVRLHDRNTETYVCTRAFHTDAPCVAHVPGGNAVALDSKDYYAGLTQPRPNR